MKNKLWEHAGCDGTTSCVAVPGVAACVFVWRGVLVAQTCPETGGVQIEAGSSSRILMCLPPSFSLFSFTSFLSHSASCSVLQAGKGHACDLCRGRGSVISQSEWMQMERERNCHYFKVQFAIWWRIVRPAGAGQSTTWFSHSVCPDTQYRRKESPAFAAPPIVDTPAVTVNICMGEAREQGVLPVARMKKLKHMSGLWEKSVCDSETSPAVFLCRFSFVVQMLSRVYKWGTRERSTSVEFAYSLCLRGFFSSCIPKSKNTHDWTVACRCECEGEWEVQVLNFP